LQLESVFQSLQVHHEYNERASASEGPYLQTHYRGFPLNSTGELLSSNTNGFGDPSSHFVQLLILCDDDDDDDD